MSPCEYCGDPVPNRGGSVCLVGHSVGSVPFFVAVDRPYTALYHCHVREVSPGYEVFVNGVVKTTPAYMRCGDVAEFRLTVPYCCAAQETVQRLRSPSEVFEHRKMFTK